MSHWPLPSRYIGWPLLDCDAERLAVCGADVRNSEIGSEDQQRLIERLDDRFSKPRQTDVLLCVAAFPLSSPIMFS